MQPTLANLLAEIRNLSFLFYGYTVIWVIVLFYAYTLSRRERSLRDEIEELKKGTVEEALSPSDGQATATGDRAFTAARR